MRGKAQAEQVRRFLNGITPAYAGKSVSRLLRKASLWDHPRVCGEKPRSAHQRARLWGSPPRMRGKVSPGSSERRACGITPAYAGKSREVLINVPGSGDHPRVCGEKDQVKSMSTEDVGSPPRMRGKESLHTPTCRNTGITPAYAGKSGWPRSSGAAAGDHPRVCGEKHKIFSSRSNPLGSPPRMRGKVHVRVVCVGLCRITPAYAGKSRRHDEKPERSEDHPRVCGEKLYSFNLYAYKIGSPPRMRGKEGDCCRDAGHDGITPAYAGKSFDRARATRHWQDHPRICGEKAQFLLRRLSSTGSPPHMRGKATWSATPFG